MNKNLVIGTLAVVVILGGGYFLTKSPTQNMDTTQQTNTSATTPVSKVTPVTPAVVQPEDTGPSVTLGSPIVTTNQNYIASSSSLLVSGQVEPYGVLTTYWFEYGENNNLSSRTISQEIGSGFSQISSPANISGLKSNTTYYFRLMANNNFGTTYGDTYTAKTNNNPAIKPSLPTAKTLSVDTVTNNSANLSGQVNENGFQVNYWFEYGKTNRLGNITTIRTMDSSVSLVANSPVSGSLAKLDPNTKYYFRLNAQNQFGTVNGSILSFTTKK